MAPQAERRRARDRESSDSEKDRKKRKKEKKTKERGDRGDRDDRKKRDVEPLGRDDRGRGYGYGGSQNEDRGRDRSDRERGDRGRKGSDHRDDRLDRENRRREEPPQEEPPEEPEPKIAKPAHNWKEEQEEDGEDLRDNSDDEEAAAKRLEESRKRRAAMMAQAKPEKTEKPLEEGEVAKDADELSRPPEDAKDEDGEAKDDETNAKKPEEEGAGDMFDLSTDAKALNKQRSANTGLSGASTDDWDDDDGYYIAQVGEMLEDRYLVQDTVSGRGVFSNVVKAKDTKSEGQPLVALKIIRSNDMMKKAAEKEVAILQTLNNADKGNKRHVIRLIETFYYRKHIFLVFECMARDLRGAVKELTKGKGMAITAVKPYTKQLLIGVRHMHKFNIIHADLKPDNILISADNNLVKLCDFGTATEAKDIGVSPYCMSRFYRPAEVIIGCEYGIAVDVWAMACTLFEIFTGKTLFQGKTNNDMLKRIMDVKGKIPKHVIKKGAVWKTHFDENLDFKYIDKDSMSGEEITRVITDCNAKKEVKEYILDRVGPEKQKSQEREDQQYVKKSIHFADLLDKMLALDPKNRITAEDALKHHFVEDPKAKSQGAATTGATPGKR